MKRRTGTIITIIVFLAIAAGGIGLYLYRMPIKDFTSSRPDYVLNASSLFEEFQKDQNGANMKYVSDEKTIQVDGKVLNITNNPDTTVTVTIDVGNPDGDISCTLTKSESVKASNLKPGMQVSLKGQCTGYQELINKEVIMIRCGVVERKKS